MSPADVRSLRSHLKWLAGRARPVPAGVESAHPANGEVRAGRERRGVSREGDRALYRDGRQVDCHPRVHRRAGSPDDSGGGEEVLPCRGPAVGPLFGLRVSRRFDRAETAVRRAALPRAMRGQGGLWRSHVVAVPLKPDTTGLFATGILACGIWPILKDEFAGADPTR